jgi:hypothetical protein
MSPFRTTDYDMVVATLLDRVADRSLDLLLPLLRSDGYPFSVLCAHHLVRFPDLRDRKLRGRPR